MQTTTTKLIFIATFHVRQPANLEEKQNILNALREAFL